jgi:hypothetical protein
VSLYILGAAANQDLNELRHPRIEVVAVTRGDRDIPAFLFNRLS